MHALKEARRDALPILDKWPEALRMENKTDPVARRNRSTFRKERQKTLCRRVDLKCVPISIHHYRGIRLLLLQEKLDRLSCHFDFRLLKLGLPVEGGVASRQQQGIALAQRQL